jgi:hypothetical protein
MTGKVYPATTAAIPYPAMSVITANTVTVTIVHSAAHIVRCVIQQSVLVAPMNVPPVTSQFARDVQPNARNAKKYFVRIV